MNRLLPVLCASAWVVVSPGLIAGQAHYKLPQQSVSLSQQFVVYCDDAAMRLATSSFAEEMKSGVLELLGTPDKWKTPIVINLTQANAAAPGGPISQVQLVSVEGGGQKIELNVAIGGDLTRANFQQQLILAMLLEMEYRGRTPPEDKPYVNPPAWLVEGFTGYLRNLKSGVDVDVYKALLASNSLPSAENFLSQNPAGLNAASLKLYQAYATSLVELLLELPNGPAYMVDYIRGLPLGSDAASEDLMKHFPPLGKSTESLEKWWVISMAHLSTSDRYRGLSVEETEKQLIPLLHITVTIPKTGETKQYAFEDYKQFIKQPEARQALGASVLGLRDLAAHSNPLFTPVVGEYLALAGDLQKGKAHRLDQRMQNAAKYRDMILTRMDQIDDYMNWFEATQMVNRSNSFEDYMKTAEQFSEGDDVSKRPDAISQYLDRIELQMQ